jgi:hypothetical protein
MRARAGSYVASGPALLRECLAVRSGVLSIRKAGGGRPVSVYLRTRLERNPESEALLAGDEQLPLIAKKQVASVVSITYRTYSS